MSSRDDHSGLNEITEEPSTGLLLSKTESGVSLNESHENGPPEKRKSNGLTKEADP
jgi:hypothetical protein